MTNIIMLYSFLVGSSSSTMTLFSMCYWNQLRWWRTYALYVTLRCLY